MCGENHLLCGDIKDAFPNFRQLRQKYVTLLAPLKKKKKKKKMYCPSRSEVDLRSIFQVGLHQITHVTRAKSTGNGALVCTMLN